MRILGVFLLIILFSNTAISQKIEITAKNGDCKYAIDISGKSEIIASAPISAGKVNEISSHKGDIYYFHKEHYTVWYSFIAEDDAILSFTITPDIKTDDYDFLLFECSSSSCCKDIITKTTKPIRTNISRTKVLADGITGLNKAAFKEYVHEGKGDNFSTSVKIFKGKKYYLLLDNVYGGNGGHTIEFTKEAISKKKLNNKPMLNINIVEEGKTTLINAQINVVHFNKEYKPDTIVSETNSALYIPIIKGDYYEISAKKDGYLYKETNFKVKEDDSLITETLELTKASIGTSFKLEKLYFVGGTAQFTGNYKSTLIKLLRSMKENPSLKIKIRGHVNRPNGSYIHKSEEYYNELSIARAKAVFNYLVKRGISESRLQYEGVGYSEMIYPNATLKSEMQQNRRVEVVVIEI